MPHFLPAIFAFLFWGKTTAESEDRTRYSSWGWVITIAAVALFFAIEYLLYRYAKSEIPTSPSDTD